MNQNVIIIALPNECSPGTKDCMFEPIFITTATCKAEISSVFVQRKNLILMIKRKAAKIFLSSYAPGTLLSTLGILSYC